MLVAKPKIKRIDCDLNIFNKIDLTNILLKIV